MPFNRKLTYLLIGIVFSGCSPESDTMKLAEAMSRGCGLVLAEKELKSSEELEVCADANDTKAMTWLGLIHWNDSSNDTLKGTLKNQLEEKGYEILQHAAKKGSVIASGELGLAYMDGLYGVPVDTQKAIELMTFAYERKDWMSAQNLAILYSRGQDIPKSKAKAIAYLEDAAEYGSVLALWTLGSLHAVKGTTKDTLIAEEYFAKANELGGECARPSEICDDFKHLFEDDELLLANRVVENMDLRTC